MDWYEFNYDLKLKIISDNLWNTFLSFKKGKFDD